MTEFRAPEVKDFNGEIIAEFRANGGRVGGPFQGSNILLLHHTGARSGTQRVSPLAFQRVGESFAVFASKAGAPTNPDWYHNVVANPDVTFEDCVLRDVDFGSGALVKVRFTGSTLVGVDFTRVQCKDVDLRGARLGSDDAPGIKAGYDSLSGTRIDRLQLMTLAPLLAQQLGIRVTD